MRRKKKRRIGGEGDEVSGWQRQAEELVVGD